MIRDGNSQIIRDGNWSLQHGEGPPGVSIYGVKRRDLLVPDVLVPAILMLPLPAPAILAQPCPEGHGEVVGGECGSNVCAAVTKSTSWINITKSMGLKFRSQAKHHPRLARGFVAFTYSPHADACQQRCLRGLAEHETSVSGTDGHGKAARARRHNGDRPGSNTCVLRPRFFSCGP